MNRILCFLIFTLALPSCKKVDKVVDEAENWRKELVKTREELQKEIQETRKVAKLTADSAIKAVPGERWLQIIDALHGKDDVKKAEAQRFLKSLANIDIETPLELSVWFEFPEGAMLHADVFRAPSPHRLHVEEHVTFEGLNPTIVSTVRLSGLTETELHNQMKAIANNAINELCGSASSSTAFKKVFGDIGQMNGGVSWSTPNLQKTISVQKQIKEGQYPDEKKAFEASAKIMIDSVHDGRLSVASQLADAMMLAHKAANLPLGDRRLSTPWLPLDGKDYCFVVLPLKDWEQLKTKGLKISALVHTRGEAAKAYQDQRRYDFAPDEFDPQRRPLVEHPVHGQMVWAAHRMSDSSGLSRTTLDRINEAKEILAKWQVEQTQ